MLLKCLLFVVALTLAACTGPSATASPQAPMPTEAPATQPGPSQTPPPTETPPGARPTPSLPAPSATPDAATTGPLPLPTSEYAVQPGDQVLQRGNLFIEDAGVKVQPGRGGAAQVLLSLSGSRPSPCHHLRVEVGPPDAANTLRAEAYTVIAADRVCQQVLRPFAAEIPVGPLAPGDYTLLVNDEWKLPFTI
jgi:hypothetical protein